MGELGSKGQEPTDLEVTALEAEEKTNRFVNSIMKKGGQTFLKYSIVPLARYREF